MSEVKSRSVVIYGAVVRAWTQIASVALLILAARRLGVADFGVFTMATVFINIVQAFLYAGVYEYVLRSKKQDGMDQTLLLLNLFSSLVGAVLSVALGFVVAKFAHAPQVFTLALWLAPSTCIAAAAAWHEAVALRDERYPVFYGAWAISETIATACAAIWLMFGGGLKSLILYRYLQSTIFLLVYAIVLRPTYRGELKWNRLPEVLRFAGPIYGSRFLTSLSDYGVDLFIGILVSPAATGLYRLANRIAFSATEIFMQPLRVLLWTRGARAGRSLRRIVLVSVDLVKLGVLIVWPAAVVLTFLTPDILRVAVGSVWVQATPIVATLLLARSFGVLELQLEPMLANSEQGKLLLTVKLVAIGAMFLLVPILARLGTSWLGVGRVAASLIGATFVGYLTIKSIGWRRALRPLSTGTLLAAVSFLLFWSSRLFLGDGFAVRVVAASGCIILVCVLMLNDLGNLKRHQIVRPGP